MSFLQQLLSVLLAFITLVSATPSYYRRQVAPVTISGATHGGVQPRLEIRDLQDNADQWNIYLLALQSFQGMDPIDPSSWYQIAGIHGQPLEAWDSVEPCSDCNSGTGYCLHQSPLFLPWHRAYLALYEQSLQTNALDIAARFTGDAKARYITAAQNLRMPYWDWTAPPITTDPIPPIFSAATVPVRTPTGSREIPNPLSSYSFANTTHPFHSSGTTYRDPTLTPASLRQQRADFWAALTSQTSYNPFSTTAEPANVPTSASPYSLEAVHNQIHLQLGGDMNSFATAAFDPAFWLHHAMVDRGLAIWQAANPKSWVESWTEQLGTYSMAQGSRVNGDTPLRPFRSGGSGAWWTSDALRDTKALGYDFADLAARSAAEVVASHGDDAAGGAQGASRLASPGGVGRKGRVDYVAEVRVDAMAGRGSFTVLLFDGEVEEGVAPASWYSAPNLIGTRGFFEGVDAMGGGIVSAGISLSSVLAERFTAGELEGLGEWEVEGWVGRELEWKVLGAGREVLGEEEVGLEIEIVVLDVVADENREGLPSWGEAKRVVKVV